MRANFHFIVFMLTLQEHQLHHIIFDVIRIVYKQYYFSFTHDEKRIEK